MYLHARSSLKLNKTAYYVVRNNGELLKLSLVYFPQEKVSISVLESESFLVMHDELVKILTKGIR